MFRCTCLWIILLFVSISPALCAVASAPSPVWPQVTDIARSDLFIRDPFILPDTHTQTYILYKSESVTLDNGESRPGVVAYTSRDLQMWRGPYPVFYYPEGLWADKSIWAPEVHEYRGKYYLFATFNSNKPVPMPEGRPQGGLRATQICVADSPLGPFKIFENKPHTPQDWLSLDGTLWEEEGVPYMIFCHEWLQITDGTMDLVALEKNLSAPAGETQELFKATDAGWVKTVGGAGGYVTDGCFLYRTRADQLLMIWSSFGDQGYTVGMARSKTGKVFGPWEQIQEPLVATNGGHGMIFRTFEGRLMMPIHQPNSGPIRMHLFELEDQGHTLGVKGEWPFVDDRAQAADQWQADFEFQPVSSRPPLEVNYTDASRTAFQILAHSYQLTGQLSKPHLLSDKTTGKPWLWFEIQDESGVVYSTQHAKGKSRINLYRRGPYFCEVHWLDLGLATPQGKAAPLKGDLALYCYPDKILAEVTWHGTGDFDATSLLIKGLVSNTMACKPFKNKTKQSLRIPLFGETRPLPDDAFKTLVGEVPFQYDMRKGCYVVGTHTSGSFQKEFYETPNKYETATFTVTNDAVPRKIYICHESAKGGAIVEGGVILDEQGQVLPLVVQVSKNFAGEKEEKFYNPADTPFSETFFPLYLEPDESHTLTSLHLYQNWGRHMTKHWSSLGAWMDYFHSSTGVTETTCYVPFKFAGIGGVSIADFRAMSQAAFWSGQPQHDNLAGHSFLSFFDGKKWQHLKYENTIYRSTGPNWFDIQLNYLSSDGSIRVSVDIWETPQADELRSFFKARYEVLKPLNIKDAQANFRFLEVTSAIQSLRFTRFGASGTPDLELDPSLAPFPVKGLSLPSENAYLALYGDSEKQRGSNAVIIREFSGPRDIKPAASVQWGKYQGRLSHDRAPNTRLLLVPDANELMLKVGDVFEIDGYWLPYGPLENADTPRHELTLYGRGFPSVTQVSKGKLVSDLPVIVRAQNNVAEFTVKGGKDLVPVIIKGLTTWQFPRVWKKEAGQWSLLSHARNTEHDGYQVFSEEGGTFGAVFLVHSNEHTQQLRVTAGKPVMLKPKITLLRASKDVSHMPGISFGLHAAASLVTLGFPDHGDTSKQPVTWRSSEGESLWFQSNEPGWDRGARISPNEEDMDLEYWWQNRRPEPLHPEPRFTLDTRDTEFEDTEGLRTWALTAKGWQKAKGYQGRACAFAVESVNGERVLAMAWNNSKKVTVDTKPGMILDASTIMNKRIHVRGKIYLMHADLDVLEDRIRKEIDSDNL